MSEEPQAEQGGINFPGGWRGLYLFIAAWGLLQVALLYFFMRAYNLP